MAQCETTKQVETGSFLKSPGQRGGNGSSDLCLVGACGGIGGIGREGAGWSVEPMGSTAVWVALGMAWGQGGWPWGLLRVLRGLLRGRCRFLMVEGRNLRHFADLSGPLHNYAELSPDQHFSPDPFRPYSTILPLLPALHPP
jgi:hypothetical protein